MFSFKLVVRKITSRTRCLYIAVCYFSAIRSQPIIQLVVREAERQTLATCNRARMDTCSVSTAYSPALQTDDRPRLFGSSLSSRPRSTSGALGLHWAPWPRWRHVNPWPKPVDSRPPNDDRAGGGDRAVEVFFRSPWWLDVDPLDICWTPGSKLAPPGLIGCRRPPVRSLLLAWRL